MFIKVQKWSNSLALKIPKSFATDARIKGDSVVEISHGGEHTVVKPGITPSLTLEQLLAGVTTDNIRHETDTGNPVGNEVWGRYQHS